MILELFFICGLCIIQIYVVTFYTYNIYLYVSRVIMCVSFLYLDLL